MNEQREAMETQLKLLKRELGILQCRIDRQGDDIRDRLETGAIYVKQALIESISDLDVSLSTLEAHMRMIRKAFAL